MQGMEFQEDHTERVTQSHTWGPRIWWAAPEKEKEVSGDFPFLKDSFPFCMLPSTSSKDNQGANREARTEGLGGAQMGRASGGCVCHKVAFIGPGEGTARCRAAGCCGC